MPVLLPDYVREVLNRLEQAGFSAYCVGGCVRDSLRGVIPNDYDLACSRPARGDHGGVF